MRILAVTYSKEEKYHFLFFVIQKSKFLYWKTGVCGKDMQMPKKKKCIQLLLIFFCF